MLAYERRYVAALTFRPRAWGIHPYHALAERSERPLALFRSELPAGGAGAELWITEIGAFYCRLGHVAGEAAQAAEAAYLEQVLAGPDAAVPVDHVLYYGLSFADGAAAPCTSDGGGDSELFAPGDRPRKAAPVLLARGQVGGSPLIGPLPGQDPLAFAPLASSG
jgi:hypothetical protein